MIHASLHTALAAARELHGATVSLRDFAPWPDDLEGIELAPRPIPAARLVAALDLAVPPLCQPLFEATRALAAHAHWKRTYSEDEVGADFRARYGYVELMGPNGHFHSSRLRAYLGFWGEGLDYEWHHHEAEELYFILAGSAEFHADGVQPATIGAGEIQYHESRQPHAMFTRTEPVLAFVLWRGAGMDGLPRMGRAQ